MSLWSFAADNLDYILRLLVQHLLLSLQAILIASLLGIALGVLVAKLRRLAGPVLGGSGVIYTIPSLALLGMMVPFFGIGQIAAMIALVLYVQFVIIRNTYAGIRTIEPGVLEAARGIGMGPVQILLRVELPLALPAIAAGVRLAAVMIVGIATVAAWIGAGGLGELIVRGLSSLNVPIMLTGALPACLLAVLLDQVLGFIERRWLNPRLGIAREGSKRLAATSPQT